MEKDQWYEDEDLVLWIEDGILFANHKRDCYQSLEDAKRIVSIRLKLQGGKSYPQIADSAAIKKIHPDAKKYLSTYGTEGVTCTAIITDNKISAITLNLLLMVVNLFKTPGKVFLDKKDAIKWVKSKMR